MNSFNSLPSFESSFGLRLQNTVTPADSSDGCAQQPTISGVPVTSCEAESFLNKERAYNSQEELAKDQYFKSKRVIVNESVNYLGDDCHCFQCDKCGKSLKPKSSLKKHILIHTKVGPFSCAACSWHTNSSSSHRHHLKSVAHILKSNSSLKKHILRRTEVGPFICAACSWRTDSSSSHRHHLRSVAHILKSKSD